MNTLTILNEMNFSTISFLLANLGRIGEMASGIISTQYLVNRILILNSINNYSCIIHFSYCTLAIIHHNITFSSFTKYMSMYHYRGRKANSKSPVIGTIIDDLKKNVS